jgi:hypothetical protein
MATKQRRSCGLKPVELVRPHYAQKPLRRVEPSGLEAQLRGGERSLSSPTGIGGQPEGTLQERGRGADASTRAGSTGASFQLPSDRLVGCGGGRSQMPGPTVRIDVRIGRLCQCEVHTPALIRWRRPVDRRANKRMPEPHGLLDREQPIHGLSCDIDPELCGCTLDEHRVTDRLSSGDE